MSLGEFRRAHTPAEILQDAAKYLSSSKEKPPHMRPIVEGFAQEVSAIAKDEVVDLSVQFRDSEGNPLDPQHVGTVQFDEWSHDDERDRWLGRFKSINAGGFNDWPTEGTVIPLGTDCLILRDVEQS